MRIYMIAHLELQCAFKKENILYNMFSVYKNVKPLITSDLEIDSFSRFEKHISLDLPPN